MGNENLRSDKRAFVDVVCYLWSGSINFFGNYSLYIFVICHVSPKGSSATGILQLKSIAFIVRFVIIVDAYGLAPCWWNLVKHIW